MATLTVIFFVIAVFAVVASSAAAHLVFAGDRFANLRPSAWTYDPGKSYAISHNSDS